MASLNWSAEMTSIHADGSRFIDKDDMLPNEILDRADASDFRRDALDPKVRPSEAYEAVHTVNRLLDQLHDW
jgi:hypothetical protein